MINVQTEQTSTSVYKIINHVKKKNEGSNKLTYKNNFSDSISHIKCEIIQNCVEKICRDQNHTNFHKRHVAGKGIFQN